MITGTIILFFFCTLLRISALSSRLTIMSFGHLLSQFYALTFISILTGARYFFMLTLPLSCQNKVRAASFIGPDPDAAQQTSNSGPRLTRVDRVIWRSSIDGVPDVIRASGAGPRAHAPDARV